MEGRGAWRTRIFFPDQRHKGRDTEELQKAVVERPDATTLLVANNRSVPTVGSLNRKWFGVRSATWWGGLERFTMAEVSDCGVRARKTVNASEAQGWRGSR